jgi:hypothetical protein
MNELNLYNTKNNSIKTNIQSGGKSNKNNSFIMDNEYGKDLSETGLSTIRLYRKRMLEQQKYINELEARIKEFESN